MSTEKEDCGNVHTLQNTLVLLSGGVKRACSVIVLPKHFYIVEVSEIFVNITQICLYIFLHFFFVMIRDDLMMNAVVYEQKYTKKKVKTILKLIYKCIIIIIIILSNSLCQDIVEYMRRRVIFVINISYSCRFND